MSRRSLLTVGDALRRADSRRVPAAVMWSEAPLRPAPLHIRPPMGEPEEAAGGTYQLITEGWGYSSGLGIEWDDPMLAGDVQVVIGHGWTQPMVPAGWTLLEPVAQVGPLWVVAAWRRLATDQPRGEDLNGWQDLVAYGYTYRGTATPTVTSFTSSASTSSFVMQPAAGDGGVQVVAGMVRPYMAGQPTPTWTPAVDPNRWMWNYWVWDDRQAQGAYSGIYSTPFIRGGGAQDGWGPAPLTTVNTLDQGGAAVNVAGYSVTVDLQ